MILNGYTQMTAYDLYSYFLDSIINLYYKTLDNCSTCNDKKSLAKASKEFINDWKHANKDVYQLLLKKHKLLFGDENGYID